MPETDTPEKVIGTLPEFVTVIDCGLLALPTARLPNERLVGETAMAAAPSVPERLTVWGLAPESSATLRVAVRVPALEVLRMTLIVQLAFAARVDPQVWVWLKSAAFVPEIVMLFTFKVALPVLLSVTVCAALATPTFWLV